MTSSSPLANNARILVVRPGRARIKRAMALPGHIKAVPQAIPNEFKQDVIARIRRCFLFWW